MKNKISFLSLIFCVLLLSGCTNLKESPFPNKSNNGFEDLNAFIDISDDLLDEFEDILPHYSYLNDGHPGCLHSTYYRESLESFDGLSNKYFYEKTKTHIGWMNQMLRTSKTSFSDLNDESRIKEGNKEIVGSKEITYYLEDDKLFILNESKQDESFITEEIYINTTNNKESAVYKYVEYENEELVLFRFVELDLHKHTEKSIEQRNNTIMINELHRDNSLLNLLIYKNREGTDYSHILFYDAIENEEFYSEYERSESLYYTKYHKDNIVYTIDLYDTSTISYNMHYLDGWNKIMPSDDSVCASLDVYLDDLLISENPNIIRRLSNQYRLVVDVQDQNLTSALLSLNHLGFDSQLTLSLINLKKEFSFDDLLDEMGLEFDYEALNEMIKNEYNLDLNK